MRRPILIAALWCSVALSTASQAQDQTFYGGCVDAAGQSVAAVPDPALPVAIATVIEDGRPLIRYNHAALPRIGELGQLFLFAHECARLNLGMAPDAARTRDEARRADCWAGDMLLRSGLADTAALAALPATFELGADDWRKLPGPVRRVDLLSCPRHLSPSLAVPAFGQEAWNACARRCGDTLLACQRTQRRDGCEAAHERCMAGCDPETPR